MLKYMLLFVVFPCAVYTVNCHGALPTIDGRINKSRLRNKVSKPVEYDVVSPVFNGVMLPSIHVPKSVLKPIFSYRRSIDKDCTLQGWSEQGVVSITFDPKSMDKHEEKDKNGARQFIIDYKECKLTPFEVKRSKDTILKMIINKKIS